MIGGEGGAPAYAGCDGARGELFSDGNECVRDTMAEDSAVIAGLFSGKGPDFSALPPAALRLYGLSANAFDAVVHAWMSELPLAAEITRFGRKVLAAGTAAARSAVSVARDGIETAERRAAGLAAADRGDPDVLAVHGAAFKVWREVDRLRGLLRFAPGENGVYAARCEPDNFVLPALGPHFQERFGETPWAIIDEKRLLCLRSVPGGAPELFSVAENPAPAENLRAARGGEWEDLWRRYHKTINNENRNNPALQRSFMPKRYWKYLSEL